MPAPGGRRPYATALLLLALGGLGLLVAYGMTWASLDVPLLAGSDDVTRSQVLTGRDLYPGAAAAGWVALAAVAGVVATRSWGRVAVAGVALLAGLAGAAGAAAFAADTAAARTGPGWVLALAAGLVVVVAASWTAARGRSWPSLGRRHERGTAAERELSAWDALDAGVDPTDDLVE